MSTQLSLFQKLKDPCVQLTSIARSQPFNPSSPLLTATLDTLYSTLTSIPAADLSLHFDPKFADYVFFPIAALLQKPELGNHATVMVLKALTFLIKYGWSKDIDRELAKQLLILLAYFVSSKLSASNTNGRNNGSPTPTPESKTAACLALFELFNAIQTSPTIGASSSMSFGTDTLIIPTIGSTVSSLLDCAMLTAFDSSSNSQLLSTSDALALQTASLSALDVLLFGIVKSPQALSTMLPAIVSALTKILASKTTKDGSTTATARKTHFKVNVQVLNILRKLLRNVFDDKRLELENGQQNNSNSGVKSLKDLAEQTKNSSNKRGISEKEKWLIATKEQVRIALSVIPSLRISTLSFLPSVSASSTQQRPELIAALANFSLSVIKYSKKALDNCVPMMLDTLVLTISMDPDLFLRADGSVDVDEFGDSRSVRERLVELLVEENANYKSSLDTGFDTDFDTDTPPEEGELTQALQERVYNWIDTVPRMVMAVDDTQSQKVLDCIRCGIEMLAEVGVLNGSMVYQRINDVQSGVLGNEGDDCLGGEGVKLMFQKLVTLIEDSVTLVPNEKLTVNSKMLMDAGPLTANLLANTSSGTCLDATASNNTSNTQIQKLSKQLDPQLYPQLTFTDLGIDVTMTPTVELKLAQVLKTFGMVGQSYETFGVVQKLLNQASSQHFSQNTHFQSGFRASGSGEGNAALAAWLAINVFEGVVESQITQLERKQKQQILDRQEEDWFISDYDGDSLGDGGKDSGRDALREEKMERNEAVKNDMVVEMYTFCVNQLQASTSLSSLGNTNSKLDTVLTVNSLKGLSLVSKYLQKEFKGVLMHVLYPVLRLIGPVSFPKSSSDSKYPSSALRSTSNGLNAATASHFGNDAIRLAAQSTLITIAQSCGYNNVHDLVYFNYDYILDSLSLDLNTPMIALDNSSGSNSSASSGRPKTGLITLSSPATTLSTLVSITGPKILPFLDDIVSALLTQVDMYHGYRSLTEGVFGAFGGVVRVVYEEYYVKGGEGNGNNGDEKSRKKKDGKAGFFHLDTFDELLNILDTPKAKPGNEAESEEMKKVFERGFEGIENDDSKTDGTFPRVPFAELSKDQKKQEQLPTDDNDIDMEGMEEKGDAGDRKEEEDEWHSPVPQKTYTLVQTLVEYSDRFLTSELSNGFMAELLDIIEYGVCVLSLTSPSTSSSSDVNTSAGSDASNNNSTETSESGNEISKGPNNRFLPILNTIWPLLVHILLTTSVPHLSRRSLQVVTTVVGLGGEFMGSRVDRLWSEIRGRVSEVANGYVCSKSGGGAGGDAGDGGGWRKQDVEEFLIVAINGAKPSTKTFNEVLIEASKMISNNNNNHAGSNDNGTESSTNKRLTQALNQVNQDAVWFEMVKQGPKSGWPSVGTNNKNYKFQEFML